MNFRDHAIIDAVSLCRQLTSHQIQRIAFSDPLSEPATAAARTRRALARLVRGGYLSRIETVSREWGGYVYQLPGSRKREPDLHGLDVAETYCRLREAEMADNCKILEFAIEEKVGRVKADAYLWIEVDGRRDDFYLEVDRASEYKPQLKVKFADYTRAYRASDQFPLVLWIVTYAAYNRLDDRIRLLNSIGRDQYKPELFQASTLDGAVKRMLQT